VQTKPTSSGVSLGTTPGQQHSKRPYKIDRVLSLSIDKIDK
jgi:hypothetical protein